MVVIIKRSRGCGIAEPCAGIYEKFVLEYQKMRIPHITEWYVEGVYLPPFCTVFAGQDNDPR
jgi:hypothetical protein